MYYFILNLHDELENISDSFEFKMSKWNIIKQNLYFKGLLDKNKIYSTSYKEPPGYSATNVTNSDNVLDGHLHMDKPSSARQNDQSSYYIWSTLEHRYSSKSQPENILPLYLQDLKETNPGYDIKNEEQEQETLKDLFKSFCSETSAHGLPHIVKKNGFSMWSAVWFMIFIGAMAGELYHLSMLVTEYLQFPSVESIRMSNKGTNTVYLIIKNLH